MDSLTSLGSLTTPSRFLWLFIGLLSSWSSFSAEFFVPSPSHPTLPAALLSASPSEQNLINLSPGVYSQPGGLLIDGSKRIVLRAPNGSFFVTSPPPNDSAKDAINLQGSDVFVTALNHGATRDPEEPLILGYTNFSRSLWWTWTAPKSGQVIFASPRADHETLIDVFDVTSGDSQPPLNILWRSTGEISLRVSSGDKFLIRVSADKQGFGLAQLRVLIPTSPINDRWFDSLSLEGEHSLVSIDTFAATDVSDPIRLKDGAGTTVWFRWTAPTNAGPRGHRVYLNTAGSDFDTAIGVFVTNQIGDWILKAYTNDSDFGQSDRFSLLSFVPTASETYYIAVDGNQSGFARARDTVGSLSLRLRFPNLDVVPRLRSRESGDFTNDSRLHVDFNVSHSGRSLEVAAGALRIRVVARATNTLNGLHLLSSVGERTLTNVPVQFQLNSPGGEAFLPNLTISCPPPFRDENGEMKLWGVFAILEEQSGISWIPVDSDFVGYGYVPSESDGGLHFGVPKSFGRRVAGQTVYGLSIVTPRYVVEKSTFEAVVIASILDGPSSISLECTNWKADSRLSLASSVSNVSVFRVGEIEKDTSLVITGRTEIDTSQKLIISPPILVLKPLPPHELRQIPTNSFPLLANQTNEVISYSLRREKPLLAGGSSRMALFAKLPGSEAVVTQALLTAGCSDCAISNSFLLLSPSNCETSITVRAEFSFGDSLFVHTAELPVERVPKSSSTNDIAPVYGLLDLSPVLPEETQRIRRSELRVSQPLAADRPALLQWVVELCDGQLREATSAVWSADCDLCLSNRSLTLGPEAVCRSSILITGDLTIGDRVEELRMRVPFPPCPRLDIAMKGDEKLFLTVWGCADSRVSLEVSSDLANDMWSELTEGLRFLSAQEVEVLRPQSGTQFYRVKCISR